MSWSMKSVKSVIGHYVSTGPSHARMCAPTGFANFEKELRGECSAEPLTSLTTLIRPGRALSRARRGGSTPSAFARARGPRDGTTSRQPATRRLNNETR